MSGVQAEHHEINLNSSISSICQVVPSAGQPV